MEELLIIGFSEKLRAIEVLPQLQRLRFEWSSDFRTAVAVEVEDDGRLRLHHSQLLDPRDGLDDAVRWKAILSAIVPMPHMPPDSSIGTAARLREINAEVRMLLETKTLNSNFLRDAAALLRPGNSAIFVILRESKSARALLSGYSQMMLHTGLGV